MVNNLLANVEDKREAGLIPGSARSSGVGNGNLLQYSCLGNPRDRGAWWATVQGITKESDMTEHERVRVHAHTHTHTHTHTEVILIVPTFSRNQ